MKTQIIVSILAVLSFANLGEAKLFQVEDVNGGTNCAACTIIVGLTEQLSIVYNTSIEDSLDRLCGYLPEGIFRLTCQQAVSTFGPVIIDG